MTKFSPCDLEVLFHCYYSPEVHPREDAPAVQSSYKLLECYGLIDKVEIFNADTDIAKQNKYTSTERGRAHIRQLCNLPLPSSAWVDSNGKLIELN